MNIARIHFSYLIVVLNFISLSTFLLPCLSLAQASLDGNFSNYSINCGNNIICSDTGLASIRYYYVAPQDGQLAIAGYASPGVLNCCNTTYQMSCNGSFRKLAAPANVHNFSDQLTTGYLDCIQAGDSIEINFNGTLGAYGYNAAVIPDLTPQDVEPNRWFADAIPLTSGNIYHGHLRYGIYEYDNRDNYSFIAPTEGTLSLQISTDEQISVAYYRQDSLYLGAEIINTNPYALSKACLASGDQIFLQFNGAVSCTGYTVEFNFIPPSFGTDAEPNNTTATAITSNDIYGAVGHGLQSPVQPDAKDYYALPYLNKDDVLEFDINLIGGPVLFRLRSQSFSGFLETLGTINNTVASFSFQAPFDDQFYLEIFTSTGNCGFYHVTVGGCVQDLVLTGNEANLVAMKSDNTISSTQHILSTAQVDYSAKHQINLNALFEVNLGAVFHAFIEGCTMN